MKSKHVFASIGMKQNVFSVDWHKNFDTKTIWIYFVFNNDFLFKEENQSYTHFLFSLGVDLFYHAIYRISAKKESNLGSLGSENILIGCKR